ncbi:MAG: cysteine desulfurase family protein [Rectinemataceae bacterium]
MIYLDWASTSPPNASILDEAARLASSVYGNPSSRHRLGVEAKVRLEEARERLADQLEVSNAGRIIFTGGGSEADALPLLALLRQALSSRRDGSIKKLHIVTTEIEHAAVYEQALLLKSLGLDLSIVKPEADGMVDPRKVAAAVGRETALVAVMAVNNETGALQNIAGVAKAVAEAAAVLGRPAPRIHVDAVQALGKIVFQPARLGISSAAFSAHKIGGPRASGALWTAGSFDTLAVGGGQEEGHRPGTESLQAAWGLARAAENATAELERNRLRARVLEARLIEGLARGALPLPLGRRSGDDRYSPFILSAAFPGLSGEVFVRALSDAGIALSTGSACSANLRKKSRRVLAAMGLAEDIAFSSIRISTGPATTESDIDIFLEQSEALYRRLKT